MSSPVYPLAFGALTVAVCGLLTACGSMPDTSKVTSVVQPYRIDRVQGNVVTREQVAALKPGMPRLLVRDILGTPLLASVFHADRWDYVFTFNRQGAESQARRVSVYFKGDVLERFEADDLPSEAEFVATLQSGKRPDKMPVLEASPEALKKFQPTARTPAAGEASLPPAAPAASYPPLESKSN